MIIVSTVFDTILLIFAIFDNIFVNANAFSWGFLKAPLTAGQKPCFGGCGRRFSAFFQGGFPRGLPGSLDIQTSPGCGWSAQRHG